MDPASLGLLMLALSGLQADMKTTRDFLAEGGSEANPILGSHPSKNRLRNAEMAAALGILLAGTQLPDPYKKPLLGALAGMEHNAAQRNRAGKSRGGLWKGRPSAINSTLGGALLGVALNKLSDKEGNSPSIIFGPKSITLTKKF